MNYSVANDLWCSVLRLVGIAVGFGTNFEIDVSVEDNCIYCVEMSGLASSISAFHFALKLSHLL